ncbi:MAG: hypothetical protein ACRD44_06305 [Bryobacteraceae bacterium]
MFLGAAPPGEGREAPGEGEAAAPAAREGRVLADLWHWKDDYVQPMQRVRANQERNRTYRGVYHIAEKKFVQLGDPSMTGLAPSDDGRWAFGTDDRPCSRSCRTRHAASNGSEWRWRRPASSGTRHCAAS